MSAHENPPTSAQIDRRLRIVAELRNLCLSLGQARKVADAPPGSGAAEAPVQPPLPRNPVVGGRPPTNPATPSDRPSSR